MAWSPNPSISRGTAPPVPVHPLSRLKWMLILSGAFHVAFVTASMMTPGHKASKRLEPVTVVDLIGGSEIRQRPSAAPPKETPPPAPEPVKAAPKEAPPAAKAPAVPAARKDDAPVKKAAEKAPKAPAKTKAPDAGLNAAASVSERVKKMREERDSAEAVRKAIEDRRSAVAAREAVRGVKERVARRIESPSAPSSSRDPLSGAGGISQGTARLSPEMMEFFSLLEERVRRSWILPEAFARDVPGLMVEVRITIEKDGRVSDTRIEKGSGNVYFDESVRRAIGRASPLPVPPERLRGGEDYYEVGFRFHGTGGSRG